MVSIASVLWNLQQSSVNLEILAVLKQLITHLADTSNFPSEG